MSLPLLILAVQEHGAEAPASVMDIKFNVMFYTLVIFGVLYFLLRKYAFGPILTAVEAREKALEDAIEGAKRDRDAAALLLAEHQRNIETARAEAQKLIAEGRATAEKMRHDLLEQTRREQQEMLERARRDIDSEKDKAIAALRREAVDLAIAGASKVIEQNLDSAANRKLVEGYLSSVGTLRVN
jgi:F-type H+-transporting ATPase subunit b